MNALQYAALVLAAAFALSNVAPALAAGPVAGDSPVIQRLKDCKAKPDDRERLACYDAVVPDLTSATQRGAVMVVDREQVRAARRQAFGFDLSALAIFDRLEKPEEVDRITNEVASAYQHADGKWVLEMADGAVWSQTDDEPVRRPPAKGSRAEIRKAAFGSYFINLDGQRAIRAHRVK